MIVAFGISPAAEDDDRVVVAATAPSTSRRLH